MSRQDNTKLRILKIEVDLPKSGLARGKIRAVAHLFNKMGEPETTVRIRQSATALSTKSIGGVTLENTTLREAFEVSLDKLIDEIENTERQLQEIKRQVMEQAEKVRQESL